MFKLPQRIETFEEYADQIDHYKDEKNYFFNELQECYKITEKFIKERKRILVGGMAIDFALKKNGSKLYSTNKIDYDFLSPEYHRDAYDLGNILTEKFDNISVIGALHASTMRVRYKFMPIADITYMPPALYDKTAVINFEGFRITYPHAIMSDQMRAFVYMAENPPRESYISERLVKDIKRFCLLGEFYPIISNVKKKIVERKIPLTMLKNTCLSGYLAAAYWSSKYKINTGMDFQIKKDHVLFKIPEDAKISLFVTDAKKYIENLNSTISINDKKTYKPILDKFPERTEIYSDNYIIEVLHCDTFLVTSEKNKDFHVLCIQGVLMYLLTYEAYISPVPLIGNIFQYIYDDFKNNIDSLKNTPSFYGENNWSETYLLAVKKQNSDNKILLPKNAYPEKNKNVPSTYYAFDPSSSDILEKNGDLIINN